MTNQQVQYGILALPDRSPLIRQIQNQHFPGAQGLAASPRVSYVMRDAAFGAHFTYAYFWAGEKLPKEIGWPVVLRAYDCLRYERATKHSDPACQRALALGHPGNLEGQALLKGLLCSELSYQEIAARFGESVDVVKTYANLFCDFPERRDSGAFVMAVLNPQSESFPADLCRITDPVLRAMNIGYHYGADMLCRELGSVRRGSGLPSQAEMLSETTLTLMDSARRKAKRDELPTDSPEYGVLKVLLATQSKQQPNSTSMVSSGNPEAMSMTPQWQDMLNSFTQKQVDEQQQAIQQFQGEAKTPNLVPTEGGDVLSPGKLS